MKILPKVEFTEGRVVIHGVGAFECFECVDGVYVPCERPTCSACGAEPPTKVREAMRELHAA